MKKDWLCSSFLISTNWKWCLSLFTRSFLCRWWRRKWNIFSKVEEKYFWKLSSSRNSFFMLKNGLEGDCFKQNKVESCLFVRNNCNVIFYVDDCCIWSKDKETIDSLLKILSKTFKLTNEGGFKSYLGKNVIKDPNGYITMSQPEIIDKIFNSLWICDESKMFDTPANVILKGELYGYGRKQEWQYCSVIGKMNYLAWTTRPDIIFAVHQCPKYSLDPK